MLEDEDPIVIETSQIKDFIKKMTFRDWVIAILIIGIVLIVVQASKDITMCNDYWLQQMKNVTCGFS